MPRSRPPQRGGSPRGRTADKNDSYRMFVMRRKCITQRMGLGPAKLGTLTRSLRLALTSYPILIPSNLCGSGGRTWNRRNWMSPQFRSGGGGGMHTVGYAGSQPPTVS